MKQLLVFMGFGVNFRTWVNMIYNEQFFYLLLDGFESKCMKINRGLGKGVSYPRYDLI